MPAAAPYIKAAADQVQQAIQALQDEINSIQHDAYNETTGLRSDAGKAETEASLAHAEAGVASSNSPADEHVLEARSVQLHAEAEEKKRVADQRSADAARAVQSKTGLINQLKNANSQLNSLASAA